MAKRSFEQLRQHWYAKLKAKGFKDIEDDKGRLVSWSTSKCVVGSQTEIESQADYYRLAGRYAFEKTFKSAQERRIWSEHASGVSINGICEKLHLKHRTVQYCLERLRKEFFNL